MSTETFTLTDAEGLLKTLWDDGARPSLRWLRTQQKAGVIPHVRIGHLVFFDVQQVRAALLARNTVHARKDAMLTPRSTATGAPPPPK